MRAQHKTLPDGTGAGQRWIMTKKMDKGRFLLDKQAAWKAQKQAGKSTWQPQQQPRQQTQLIFLMYHIFTGVVNKNIYDHQKNKKISRTRMGSKLAYNESFPGKSKLIQSYLVNNIREELIKIAL